MTIHVVMQSLALSARRYESIFQSARAGDPALGAYPAATALLSALADQTALPIAERQALVLAVLLRHKSSQHPLWQALLLGAFEPLLRGLRERDRGSRSDRDQRVLAAFLQALNAVRIEGTRLVFLAVARATARALFQAVRAERDQLDEAVAIDECLSSSAPGDDPPPFTACLANELARHLASRPGGMDVVRVLAGWETGAEQAARIASTAPINGEKPVNVTCLRKRRHRALADLRGRLKRDARQVRR